jgi:hypothetical protein
MTGIGRQLPVAGREDGEKVEATVLEAEKRAEP